MTWILGSAMPFGYGALISDIRVTFPDGRQLDVLQKIYPVGSMMMVGFAGSVGIGFSMIHDLEKWLYLEQPDYLAKCAQKGSTPAARGSRRRFVQPG